MASLDVAALTVDEAGLQTLGERLRQEYVQASPWPHVVVRDLVDPAVLDSVRSECSRVDESHMMRTAGRNQVKQEVSSGLGPATTALLETLESPAFADLLTAVTGIEDLQPDPSHVYAGVHETSRGGFTLIHRDFRRHPVTELRHRVNVLLYLNKRWEQDWGGGLELWPSDMNAVGRRIPPVGNTLVFWETHDQTLHGLPEPVACPEGMSRLSLASYWYTEARRAEPVPRRRPVFARRPQDGWRVGRRPPLQVLRERIPGREGF